MALDRDPAGELGTTEWDDEEAEYDNEGLRDLFSREPVWQDFAPDMHGYVRLHAILTRVVVVALVFIVGLLVGHFL